MTSNFLTVNSTLGVSTLNASSMTSNFLTVNSTLGVSTISVSTLTSGNSINSLELTFSSLFSFVTSLQVAPGTTFHSSLIIKIGADTYKIPLEKI
jgi:hypothetical protein